MVLSERQISLSLTLNYSSVQFSSVAQSCWRLCDLIDSAWTQSQHARLPCPSPNPGAYSNSNHQAQLNSSLSTLLLLLLLLSRFRRVRLTRTSEMFFKFCFLCCPLVV